MWINFSVTLAISWLILQVKCDDIPYSDMYLPDGTNGFVCDLEFHSIDHVREEAKRGVEAFFSKTMFGKFPTTFEDTQLFNVKSDILLSWPIMSSRLFYRRTPGKSRLIINTRGQIMGIVLITSKKQAHEIILNKCTPVRRFLEENNEGQTMLNECWGLAYPTFGYNCGMKFFPKSMLNSILGPDLNKYYQQGLSGKNKPLNLQKYTGDEFSGIDLYWYPVQQRINGKPCSGPPGKYRAVFDMSNGEFKGIINIKERNEKCVTVWDVSSISSNNIYISSSTLNLDGVRDSIWPQTCLGHKFKSKIIWLYLELALKIWMSALNRSSPNLPIENQTLKDFLLLKPEETNKESKYHVFAIGHDPISNAFKLYLVRQSKDKLGSFTQCLQFSDDNIQQLQKYIGDKHNPEESLSLDHW
ncbi:putative candidate secreted effector protein [Blumeria hordei DH14]|uniref:Putative candidate secreted effector protein n=1 Tax=Blumeria graminis f. sp. hordei (strain DH14) TaxID=546991 RepID=N1J707_BLUG1|nr:putative candidate secreted effector protein [Blumeria hordei DH14]